MDTLRLASLGTPIAIGQTARMGYLVESRLRPLKIVDVIVESSLDQPRQIARLVEKLLRGEADAALCPATRLPESLPAGIALGAVVRDRDPRYRCVAAGRPVLEALPPRARIIACDPIARAQILHRLPGLRVDLAAPSWEIFAGLRHHAWDAACLPPEVFDVGSVTGLRSEPVDEDELLPASGQGVALFLVPATGGRIPARLADLNDADLEARFAAERAFLVRAGERRDCVTTVRARRSGTGLELTGLMAEKDGMWLVHVQAQASWGRGVQAALDLADRCGSLADDRRAGRTTRALAHVS